MATSRKKDLIREYKERETRQGIVAVRCAASGDAWVAASRNVDTQANGIWFQLKLGNHRNRALQDAWNAHGESGLAFEVLEVVSDDNALLIPVLLKERLAHWTAQLNAQKLIG